MKRGKKRIIAGATMLAVAALLCVGCATQQVSTQADQAAPSVSGEAGGKLSLSEWAEAYPLQYGSFATLKTKEWTDSYEGHYSLGLKLLAPIAREGNTIPLDANGDMGVRALTYDDASGTWVADVDGPHNPLESRTTDVKGCYQCKTSNFDDLLAQSSEALAAEPLDQEFIDSVNGQIWDCYLCHTESPEAGYDSTITMFKETASSIYDSLAPDDRVCGQCHNHVVHSPMFKSGIAWSDYQPFKYGLDADSVLKAAREYGFGTLEESTGITTYRSSHAEMEITIDSNHHALGVTCADCHMPQATDETTGKTYRDHNASQSPLENEASIEYCLSCHKSQGIETADEMVAMVRGLQDQTAQTGSAIEGKLANLHDLIEQANKSGDVDEGTLDQARELYTTGKFYLEWGTFGNGSGYVKVVHNPELIASLMQRAEKTIDEATALFG